VVTRGRAIAARAAGGVTVEYHAQWWLDSSIDGADGIEGSATMSTSTSSPQLGPRPLAEVTSLLQGMEVGVSWPAARRLWSTLQGFFTDAVADG
jgi:hypothetical protein